MQDRSEIWGMYIAQTGATVRKTAEVFSVSKSTVHKDVTRRLSAFNAPLAEQVRIVLDTNKAQRHLRGGDATKRKYMTSKCCAEKKDMV